MSNINFSDKIVRDLLDEVYVIRTDQEMEAREESNSNLWELHRSGLRKGHNIYKTVVRDVKVGENIYNASGKTIAYRIE